MSLVVDPHPEARARVAARREGVERLLELGRVLPAGDRALIEQVFRRGATSAEIARLTGVPPYRMQRRRRLILGRLRHPLYAFAIDHMELIPYSARGTVKLVLFHGMSLRGAARRRGKTLHEVRSHMHTLAVLAHR